MIQDKKRVVVDFMADEAEKIDESAKERGITRTAMIRNIINEYFERKKGKRR